MTRLQPSQSTGTSGAGSQIEPSLLLAVQKAHRALARRLDAALQPAALTGHQVMVLASISKMRARRAADLARELLKDHSTISANLKLLQKKDLMRSSRDAGDVRVQILSLTEIGTETLQMAWTIVQDIESAASNRLAGGSTLCLRDLGAMTLLAIRR